MRKMVSLLSLLVLLAVASPAQAQLRANVGTLRAPARLFDNGGAGVLLNKLFSPEHFKMMHTFEMSAGSYTGSMGMYTNSMMWQFNNKLAARVDVSYAQSFGGGVGMFSQENGMGSGRVFLRNAEIAYKPSENVRLHLSFQQSPYGSYMGPYGTYNPFYQGYGFRHDSEDIFWKDARR